VETPKKTGDIRTGYRMATTENNRQQNRVAKTEKTRDNRKEWRQQKITKTTEHGGDNRTGWRKQNRVLGGDNRKITEQGGVEATEKTRQQNRVPTRWRQQKITKITEQGGNNRKDQRQQNRVHGGDNRK
jgi:hypothetical protein